MMSNETCVEQERTISASITRLEAFIDEVKVILGIDGESPKCATDLKADRIPTVILLRDRLDAIANDLSMIAGNLGGI